MIHQIVPHERKDSSWIVVKGKDYVGLLVVLMDSSSWITCDAYGGVGG